MNDKELRDLHKLFDAQDFKNEDEMKAFLENLIGQQIPEFKKEDMDEKDMARDIIFNAYNLPPKKIHEAIESALMLDPECIDAYELLGNMTDLPEISICFYKRGVDIGHKIFGGTFLEKHEGMFWGLHETRPFMRCMYRYANCLYELELTYDAIAVLEEMIILNPEDNQGIRNQMMLYLIELNEFDKYKQYARQFDENFGAFPLYNIALYAFKTEGECTSSNDVLKEAIKSNKYVPAKLASKKQQGRHPFMG